MHRWSLVCKKGWSWYILLIVLVSNLLLSSQPVIPLEKVYAVGTSFSDLSTYDPAYVYVNYLSNTGIMRGYQDGSFHLEKPLTRAEIAVILCNTAKLDPFISSQSSFSDVGPQHWAYPYVEAVFKAGLIKGNQDGSFRPDDLVTRAQMAALIIQLSGEPIPDTIISDTIKDIPAGFWAYKQISSCLDAGILRCNNPSLFAPDEAVTRAQVARSLAIFLNLAPKFTQTGLTGELTPLEGEVSLIDTKGQKVILSKSVACSTGDVIKTGVDGKARLDFSDGSSILIAADTEIKIIKAKGQAYVKKDGTPGTMVDGLEIMLSKGRISSGLAADYFFARNNNRSEIKRGLPDETGEDATPWWEQMYEERERLTVDMPWGVAGVRGTISSMFVNSHLNSASILDGSLQLTGGGRTVTIDTLKPYTAIYGSGLQPSEPGSMPATEIQAWLQDNSWLNDMMDRIAQNAPLNLYPRINGQEELQSIFASISDYHASLASSLIFEGSGGGTLPDISASFTDPNFRQAVWEWLGNPVGSPPGPFTQQDLMNRALVTPLMNVPFKGITSLAGLENFEGTGLQALDCSQNNLTILPQLPSNLVSINCSQNQLNSLPLLSNNLSQLICNGNNLTILPPLPSGLTMLQCHQNQLTNLPPMPNSLVNLVCSMNQLNTIPDLSATSVTTLLCGANQLLNLPGLPDSLEHLGCEGNQISSLPPALPSHLIDMTCSYNTISSLPAVLPANLTGLDCSHNRIGVLPPLPVGLLQLACGNNHLTALPALPAGLQGLGCEGNVLTDLPALPGTLNDLLCSDNYLNAFLGPIKASIDACPAAHKVSVPQFRIAYNAAIPYNIPVAGQTSQLVATDFLIQQSSDNITWTGVNNPSINDFTFTSNDITVASVDAAGLVTGVANGDCALFASYYGTNSMLSVAQFSVHVGP
ncbi:MAG: S-layer homology domain-containing protein [Syntrophomonadaceae bacterium]